MRLLIIDDDPGIRRLLRTVAERAGYEVELADDGAAGWRLLSDRPLPDVLILDRMLPGMDGADLLRRIRADGRTRRLPVVMLTAAARHSAELDDGTLTRIVGKPFDLVVLRGLLTELAVGAPAIGLSEKGLETAE